jgi:type II secretory pathway pseudopilin PulG
MEMLIVVAIIVALAGMGGYYFIGQLNESKKKIARTQAKVLEDACNTFQINHGSWPPNLESLLQNDGMGGPYLKDPGALVDPWHQPYLYNPAGPNNNGLEPDIWSQSPYGPIGNWPAQVAGRGY